METNELTEIALLLLALIFLLYLANFLAAIGTFDEIQVLRGPLQPILVAVSQQRAAQPGLSPVMQQIAQQVRGHGVEEDADSILGTDRHEIQRGEMIGIYYASVHPFMKNCAALQGVVIDVGERRVSEASRAEWAKRLARKNADLSVQIVSIPDMLQIASRFHGPLSEKIAHWRVYRKLIRRLRTTGERYTPHPMQIMESISVRKKRVVSLIPVAGEIQVTTL